MGLGVWRFGACPKGFLEEPPRSCPPIGIAAIAGQANSFVMQVVKAGALYFALVFAIGLVLGIIRTLWVVPRLGARKAELAETPIMLAVSLAAAHWAVLRLNVPSVLSVRLGMGGVALALMLLAEFGLVLWLRGLSIRQYLATRDPVSGTIYYMMLGAFAVLPIVAWR